MGCTTNYENYCEDKQKSELRIWGEIAIMVIIFLGLVIITAVSYVWVMNLLYFTKNIFIVLFGGMVILLILMIMTILVTSEIITKIEEIK